MIIFNEEQEAIKMLSNVNSDEKIKSSDIFFLAKYFKYLKMSDEETHDELVAYIKNKCNTYNQPVYDAWIDNAIINSHKYPLRTNTTIYFTDNEINKVLEIDDFKIQKVMFIILATSKYYYANKILNDSDYKNDSEEICLYFRNSLKDVFKLACVPYSKKENIRITRWLEENEYVEWHYSGGCKILIADFKSHSAYSLKPHETMVNFLYQFKNKKTFTCSMCGKWEVETIKDKIHSNRQYCDDCSKSLKRSRNAQRYEIL